MHWDFRRVLLELGLFLTAVLLLMAWEGGKVFALPWRILFVVAAVGYFFYYCHEREKPPEGWS